MSSLHGEPIIPIGQSQSTSFLQMNRLLKGVAYCQLGSGLSKMNFAQK